MLQGHNFKGTGACKVTICKVMYGLVCQILKYLKTEYVMRALSLAKSVVVKTE